MRRLIVGFVVSPAIGALAVALTIGVPLTILAMAARGDPLADAPLFFLFVAGMGVLIGAPLAYAGMLLVGLPAFLLLRRKRRESLAAYAVIGAVGGFFVGPFFGSFVGGSMLHSPAGVLLSAYGGALVLASFWRLARRGAPDASGDAPPASVRDHQKKPL